MDRFDKMELENSLQQFRIVCKSDFLILGGNENPQEGIIRFRLDESDAVTLICTAIDFCSNGEDDWLTMIEEIENDVRKELSGAPQKAVS